ncbi:uncharacterized protein [Pyxicephalus adspersus]|uniref:uncharacterized protein isoform X3 n=1 Tax=Pyxicephalus adspersus TaxID=30357 RepID=UPI003B5A7663
MPHLFLYVSIVHGEVLKPQLCLAVQTSQDKMTVYFFICWCLVIYLPRLSQSCDSIKSLSFEEGKDVILNLNLSIPVTAVTWNYKKHIIAITKPGQPVKMGEFASDYTGRLGSSTKDGSLSIRALSSKDIRVYRAELFTSEKYICAQLFDLKISGDLGLSPRIVANKYLPSTPSTEQTKPSMTAKLGHELVKFSGRNTTSAGMYTLWNGIHLALSAFVLILAVCILVYHCRTECSTNM